MARDPRKLAISVSLMLAVLVLIGKWIAYLLTSSTAIFSDAAESVVHIAATGIAAYSIWYAMRPADAEHLYGHGKFAYFSAGFEGALLLAVAASIFYAAIVSLIRGPVLHNLGVGIVITASLGLVNLALGIYLIRVGRRESALALVANGHHVLSDMWTSLGVVLGVVLVAWTGAVWLDPLVAVAVGVQISSTGFALVRKAYHGLMDRVEPEDSRIIQESLSSSVAEGLVSGFHQLRHRQVDDMLMVEMHLLLPGELSLAEAHERVSVVEEKLREELSNPRVLIYSHLEPSDHGAAHPEGHELEDPLTE
ncbi:MAG: cation diffusion facilitator family transporter [Planctomycetota bacterium]